MITHSDEGPEFEPDDPLAVILRPTSDYLGPPPGRYEAIRRGATRRRLLRTAAGVGLSCAFVTALVALPLHLTTPETPPSPTVPLAPPPASSPSSTPTPSSPPEPTGPIPSEQPQTNTPDTPATPSTPPTNPAPQSVEPSEVPNGARATPEVSPQPREP